MAMKGITPIIAIIVLLLITVALAGVAYSYLNSYMTGLTSKSIEVRDAFCVGGGTATVIIANVGTTAIATSEITILDSATGDALTGTTWTDAAGAELTGSMIPESGLAKFTRSCSGTCSYRIVSGDGRTHSAKVTC